MVRSWIALALLTLLLCAAPLRAATQLTYCNPIDLDYGIYQLHDEPPHRHGADPAIALFKDRYWLFSTWDRPGYRVSDDLVHWKYIPFGPSVILPSKTYTAAAVAVIDGWLYFTEFGRASKPVALYRTQNPADGSSWEKVADMQSPYADPCLFLDPPSGKVFMYHGLDKPIHGVELDRKTFAEIPGTDTELRPPFDRNKPIKDGWEVCTTDCSEQSKPMRGNKTFFPCREGSWMTFHDGKYYLQYASPGTTVDGYADGLLLGDHPLGPFTYSQTSPISHKDSGFIASAGHSCLFQDRYGNWWRAVTMLIGVHERMERRIGLFPAGFDKDGVLYTRTELDTPITMPTTARDQLGDVYTPWQALSPGCAMTASSSLPDHHPALAADENIRTWWSAKTGGSEEWLQMDLGAVRDIHAVQVNLYEQDCAANIPASDDRHRFSLAASSDGKNWVTIVDRSNANQASPHAYVPFETPVRTRYLKLSNIFMPGGGKFAVSDLRVFGNASDAAPAPVADLSAARDASDRRKVTITWKPTDGAMSYLIRYGIAADKLYQPHLVRAIEGTKITLYTLNSDAPYFFRVDAINTSDITAGTSIARTP